MELNYRGHPSSELNESNSNINQVDDDNYNDENLNVSDRRLRFNLFGFIKSWASPHSRKYQSEGFGNHIDMSIPSQCLSEDPNVSNIDDDTDSIISIDSEGAPLIPDSSDLGDTKNYRALMGLGKSSVRQTIFNAVNIFVGIAILALPFALKYSGWIVGTLTFLFCLISTNYTAKIIKKCLDTDPECLTYADFAYTAYGNKGRFFMGVVFLMDLYTASVALMILVGDSLKTLFPQSDLTQLKLIAFFIITPMTWLPIRCLSYTSFLGIVASVALTLVMLIDGFTKLESPGSLIQPMETDLWPRDWTAVPLTFGLINSGFTGHAVLTSLYRDMAKPSKFRRMVNSTYFITSIIYVTVAAAGYLMFGQQTMQEITQNLMATPSYSLILNSFVVWLIVINPLTKFPLTLTPINLSIEVMYLKIPHTRDLFRSGIAKRLFIILSRTLLSFIVVYTSIVFPRFDQAVSLLGSSFSFLIATIFPILCNLKMFGRTLSKYEIMLSLFYLVISTIMAVLGTISTFMPREWIEVK